MLKKLNRLYSLTTRTVGVNLGLDVDYFLRGGVYGLAQQGVGLISGLVIAYSFGHFASKFLFGEYNLLLSIVSLLSLVSMPGLNTALLRSVGEGYDASLPQVWRKRLMWSLLAVPIFVLGSWYYRLRGSDVIPSLLILAAVFFPFTFAFQVIHPFFVAKKRFDLGAMFSGISSVLTATLVSAAVIFTHNLALILTGYFVGLVVPAVWGYIRARRMIRPSKTDTELMPYGYFLTAIQILPTAVGQAGNILLASMLGVDVLAVYTVATKFPMIVQKNFDVFYQPVAAKLAEQSAAEHKRVIATHLLKLGLLGGAMFGVLWLGIPFLVKLFYGQQYVEAVGYARLYALTVLPLPLTWVLGDIITFQKVRRLKLTLNTVLPIVTLAAYVWVIPRWQITGLIAIILAERYLTLLISGIYVLRRQGLWVLTGLKPQS